VVKTPVRLGEVADLNPLAEAAQYAVILFSAVRIASEVTQGCFEGLRYLANPLNIVEWAVFSFAGAFLIPFWMEEKQTVRQWSLGALALFFAWINLLLFIRKFDGLGIYILMFEETLKTVAKVRCNSSARAMSRPRLTLFVSTCRCSALLSCLWWALPSASTSF
jgi:transient receptor potential cation channel subfamily A protein 1